MGGLLVITGPPGAGKSTVAAEIGTRLERSAVVTGDSFFEFLAVGRTQPWLPEAHDQNSTVIRAAASGAAAFVRGGYDTIYDGVLGPWFLATFADAAGLETFDYVILFPSLGVCLSRVMGTRDHDFSDEAATRHLHRDFAQSEIDARHILDPADVPPDQVADLVLDARRSALLAYSP